jgi:hypothetical protein
MCRSIRCSGTGTIALIVDSGDETANIALIANASGDGASDSCYSF